MFEVDLLSIRPMLGEAKTRQDLTKTLARLRSKSWNERGWPRKAILAAIDDSFAHHREHYEKMMGGDEAAGYWAAKGIRSVNLHEILGEAEIVVDGSREWNPEEHAYSSHVRFSNYEAIRDATGLGWLDKARMLLEDNVRVDCDCAAFRYFYRYNANKKGFGLVAERRKARVTNPHGRGAVCKHLEHALRYVGSNYAAIASAMKKHHEFVSEGKMHTVSESLVCGHLKEDVDLHGITDTIHGLIAIATKRGMAKTANLLRTAAIQAGLDGDAGPTTPANPDTRSVPAPDPDH